MHKGIAHRSLQRASLSWKGIPSKTSEASRSFFPFSKLIKDSDLSEFTGSHIPRSNLLSTFDYRGCPPR